MRLTEIKPGVVFGRLTVIDIGVSIVSKSGGRRKAWKCLCSCGKTRLIREYSLRSGDTSSCGCLHREMVSKMTSKLNLKHGRYGTPEYKSWQMMKERCYYPSNDSYKNYGGRGITICERWRNSFAAFFEDMGLRPGPGYSLDRINPNRDYEPGNCRWATPKQQLNNQRGNRKLTISGKTRTLQEWADLTGINRSTISSRIENGWPLERAISKQTGGPA